MLDPQTCINGIDRFLKSHILPDLPDRVMDYFTKADEIYLATSWKKQGGPSLLSQSAEGVESLGALLPNFRVKSKKSANFFLIFEIFRDISEPEDEELTFRKQSHKRAKLLAKKEKKFGDIFQIKTEPISSSILIKEEDIKPKLEIQDSSLNLISKDLSGIESDTSSSDSDDNISSVNTIFPYIFILTFINY